MISRILPKDEWYKLKADVPQFSDGVLPLDVEVAVVEDGDRIIARLYVMKMPHYEGAWIDPAYRGNLGVTRALLRASSEQAKKWTSGVVLSGVIDDHMRDVMERMGGTELPATFYVVPV